MKKILIVALFVLVSVSFFAGTLIDALNDSVAAIKEKIEANNLPWKAGISDVFKTYEANGVEDLDFLSDKWTGSRDLPFNDAKEVWEYYYSFKDQATTRDSQLMSSEMPYVYTGTVLPESFIQIHTSPKDQAIHGTCWSFGTTAAFESGLLVNDGMAGGTEPDPTLYEDDTVDLAEQFMAYHNVDWDVYLESYYTGYLNGMTDDMIVQDSNLDAGGNQYFAAYNMIRYGMPNEEDFPYQGWDYNDNIRWNPTNNDWSENLVFSTKSLLMPPSDPGIIEYSDYINSIKETLYLYGTLAVSYSVPDDFNFYTGGIYIPTTGGGGGHCTNLVGWIDLDAVKDLGWIAPDAESVTVADPWSGKTWYAREFWVIKNSWSPDWGWNGYYVVPMASEDAYDNGWLSAWMIENRDMRLPYVEEIEVFADIDIDFNDDMTVNNEDFALLTDALGKDIIAEPEYSIFDISNPKDNMITVEDIMKFIMICNTPD